MQALRTADAIVAEAKRELWFRGDLSFKFHAGQHRINAAYEASAHDQFFFAECARQFAKTTWAVEKINEAAVRYPGCSLRIATAYYADIKGIILPAFKYVLEDVPDELRPSFRRADGAWVWPNGSECVLVGLDTNPEKLRGTRLRLVVIDEAAFVRSETLQYVVDSVIVPAFTHEPDARCIFISTPPREGSDHSFCDMADAANERGAYIKLTIHDNPLLSPERRKQIEAGYRQRRAMVAYRREYLCERIVDAEKAIVPEWDPKRHVFVREAEETDQFLHRYIFLDIGVRLDLTVALFALFDFPGQYLYIEDEVVIRAPLVTTRVIHDELAAGVERRGEAYRNPYRRVADNSHPLLINDLATEHSLSFLETDKAKLHEMVSELRDWTRGDRVRAHPRCKHFIGSMSAGTWDDNRKEFSRSKTYGHYDAVAAAVYGVRNTDQQTNPIPKYFGRERSDTFVIPEKEKPMSDSALGMKRAFERRGR